MSDLLPTKREIVEHLRSGGRVEWMIVVDGRGHWSEILGTAETWEAGHTAVPDDCVMQRFRLLR